MTRQIANRNIYVCSGAYLKLINSNIELSQDRKIITLDGGRLDIENCNLNWQWAGIEFQGNSYGNITNTSISSTVTPITIQGNSNSDADEININNCYSLKGTISIYGRDNVIIQNCNWNVTESENNFIGINCSNSDNISILSNTINYAFTLNSSGLGIAINYGENVVLTGNNLNNLNYGISVSNTSPYIDRNNITTDAPEESIYGISLDNSYSASIKRNTITKYPTGIYMFNSSSVMFNNAIANGEAGGNALETVVNSFPRLHPTFTDEGVYWDGGINTLISIQSGNGIYLSESEPDISYGYNEINGYNYYMVSYDGPPNEAKYYMECNKWGSSPPELNKFNLPNRILIYEPYDCEPPPGGGSHSSDEEINHVLTGENPDPPPPIIINYGHGVFDTIAVSSSTRQVSADQLLYAQAVKNQLNGNYGSAFNQFQQIILNYQDSLTALNSLRRLIECKDKMTFDSSAYFSLRAYYIGLSQQNQNDTAFRQVSTELAAKCLVRLKNCPGAITEYEEIINNTIDSSEILCSEINIIETYMIIQQGGDSPGFTGQLQYLKPNSYIDGIRMIREKLHKIKSNKANQQIPRVFRLSQNYPNPFNPVTKINYDLPVDSKVNIIIYDILGREVKRLVNNEIKQAGSYVVEFNGLNFASGVYFYRIEAEHSNGKEFVESKKMILIK